MIFKRAREGKGLSQQALAQELGIDQSAVSLWESGKTKPRANLLPKVAKLLGCTVDELLTDETQTPNTPKS